MASRVLLVCLFVFSVAYAAPSEEKQQFECTGDNEYYEECSIAVCFKSCNHLANMPACASVASPCISPKCLCKSDFLRDDKGDCVPVKQCKEYDPKLYGDFLQK